MAFSFLLLTLLSALLCQAQAGSPDFLTARKFSAVASVSEKSWLWGWIWGADSEVSIVDRSPPLTFASRPAAFGAELSNPLLGYVIPVSSFARPCVHNASSDAIIQDNLGCPPLCVIGPDEPKITETWIALVQRGDCPFVAKVREAQRLGAKAVVVGGDDPDVSGNPDALVNMYSQEDSSDIVIASTFIKYSDYMMLNSLIETSNTTHSGLRTLSLLITTEYSAWEWYSPILTFMIILLLPSSLTFITLLIHRIRAVRAAQRDRAPEDVVRNLPWRVWNGTGWEKNEGADDSVKGPIPPSQLDIDLEEGLAESSERPDVDVAPHGGLPSEVPWCETQVECAICLSDFVKGDKVRVLPCHHIFHIDEVDEWLIHRKKLCPVCKADVTRPPHNKHRHPPGHPGPAPETGLDPDAVHFHSPRSASPPPHSEPESTSRSTERTPLLHGPPASPDAPL